jgi:hypothetical protein
VVVVAGARRPRPVHPRAGHGDRRLPGCSQRAPQHLDDLDDLDLDLDHDADDPADLVHERCGDLDDGACRLEHDHDRLPELDHDHGVGRHYDHDRANGADHYHRPRPDVMVNRAHSR